MVVVGAVFFGTDRFGRDVLSRAIYGACVSLYVAVTSTDVRPLVTGERVIRGSSYGRARTREDLPRMVNLYLAGKLRIDELVTRRYGLDEANEAFRALAAAELARGLIVF